MQKKKETFQSYEETLTNDIVRLQDELKIMTGKVPDTFTYPYGRANENTVLITMMLVNNENGCILPVKNVFQGIKKLYPHIITHCDAVQGFLKIPVNISGLNADLLTVSGHKVHAAKGTGALYVKKGVRLIPCTFGGKQEKGIRSGTESVPLIAGLNAAAEKLLGTIDERYSNSAELKKILLSGLSEIDRIVVNSNDDYSPYIVNFSVLGIRSEIMLHYLESRNIFVSSGSACSKGAKSSVLRVFGAKDDIIDSAIRISFCGENTAEEVKLLIDAVNDGRIKLKGTEMPIVYETPVLRAWEYSQVPFTCFTKSQYSCAE
jgi:cysteine desulfurase